MQLKLAFALVVLIWSTTPLAIKWSNDSLSFIAAAGLRMALAALICSLILLLRGRRLRLDRQALLSYAAAVLGVFGCMSCVYWAAQSIASGMISVIFGLSPVAAGLLAAPLLGERAFTPAKLLALCLSLTGLTVIFHSELQLDLQALPGLVALLVGTLLFALSNVLVKRSSAGMDPMVHTAGSLLMSLPLFLLAWWLVDGSLPQAISLRSLLAVSYLAIVGSVIGFVMFLYLLQRMEASRVALIPLITPGLALIWGTVLAGEQIAPTTLAGSALVICGLAVYQLGGRVWAWAAGRSAVKV